jgi:ethanolamine utilization protein EutQ
VDGATVNFGALQGVIGAESVGVADVITAADKSPMSVGYMEWKDSFFPWKTASDEIEVVLDGVLHIRCDGQEIVCNAGDVIFIPRGSHVELGTTSHIRFLYVTCADPKRAA